jgi:hypothetical protein
MLKPLFSADTAADPVFSEYQRFGFVGALKKPFKIEEFKDFVSQRAERTQLDGVRESNGYRISRCKY